MALKHRFRTKFILVTGVGILIGLTANVWVASSNLNTLGRESIKEMEKGLGQVSNEYLNNYIQDATTRIDSMFRQAMADTKMLADITQALIDRGDELQPLYRLLPQLGSLWHEMVPEPSGPWVQSKLEYPSSVTVYGDSLGPNMSIPDDIWQNIRTTALLDLVMPAIKHNGSDKLQVYYVSRDEASLVRLTPAKNLGASLDEMDDTPDNQHNRVPFWAGYFPGLSETWKLWVQGDRTQLAEYSDPAVRAEMRQITLTPPYDDEAGGGMVVSIFHPLWTPDRKQFNGAVASDLRINNIIEVIQTVALGKTGFAFLAQSNGDIVAIKQPEGVETLQLVTDRAGKPSDQALVMQGLSLRKSADPAVVALALPEDDEAYYEEMIIAGKPYLLAMRRMGQFSLWNPALDPAVQPESWTLGFLVPRQEIYNSLIASQDAVERSTEAIRTNQLIVMLITLVVVLFAVYWIAERMTTDLVSLSDAASRMARKEYDVRVDISTEDEVGHLGVVFNEMADEIQTYTQNLEALVEQRTADLRDANEEIKALNERLAEENVRLAAEIDVARRLQMMVLPHPDELQAIDELDIDGYMKPADEVGGDYYDVLEGPNGVMFGMGDVTGHGLESGVLMLMVQTAVRALLNSGESDPARFLDLVNRTVFLNKQRMDVDRNLSLCLLEYREGRLVVTGQHEEIIVVRADGEVEIVDTTPLGFPIGLDLDVLYLFASENIALHAGDTVILYTDGITEAENKEGRYYGTERLCETAARVHAGTAKDIREAIVADIMDYIGDNEVFDDITLLVIKKT